MVPTLLTLIPPAPRDTLSLVRRWTDNATRVIASLVVGRPGLTATVVDGVLLAGVAAVPSLESRQKFNAEGSDQHWVRVAQRTLEQNFEGILGPEIELRREDGDSLLKDDTLAAVSAFVTTVAKHPEAMSVRSYLDLLPSGMSLDEKTAVPRSAEDQP